ncbi:MAG: manganese efflux pump [Blautia sp.]|nr:manganese efflux pump [Blautia sp.]
MQIIPSLLFGISASLDALLIGISYGIRSIRIHLWQNLLVSGITLAGTCLSVGFGSWLSPRLPLAFSRYAGSMVLMLLGVWYVVKWLVKKLAHERGTAQAAAQPIPRLSFPEVLGLGVSLSLNNIGIGLSASIAGLTLFPAATATLACSLLFLFAGNRLGRSRFLQFLGAAADPVSGILLMLLSFLQAFL